MNLYLKFKYFLINKRARLAQKRLIQKREFYLYLYMRGYDKKYFPINEFNFKKSLNENWTRIEMIEKKDIIEKLKSGEIKIKWY